MSFTLCTVGNFISYLVNEQKHNKVICQIDSWVFLEDQKMLEILVQMNWAASFSLVNTFPKKFFTPSEALVTA